MRNFYYLYWVDAIVGFRKNNPKRNDWKFTVFTLSTTCNALNIWVILLWLKFFNIFSFEIAINIFPGTILNSASGFIVYFASPFILLNYFLIFHHDRYKKLVEIYPNSNGKLAMVYGFCSVLIGFISMILYGTLK
jgi:hypothetical protein